MIDSILPALGLRPTLRIVYVAPLPRAPLTRLHPAFCPSFVGPRFSALQVTFSVIYRRSRSQPCSIRSLQLIQAFGLPTALP